MVLCGSAGLVVVVVATFLATNGFGFGGSASPRATPIGWGWVRSRLCRNVVSSVGRDSDLAAREHLLLGDSASPIFTSGSVCLGPPGTEVCLLPLRQAPRPMSLRSPPSSTGCRSTLARAATTTCHPWASRSQPVAPSHAASWTPWPAIPSQAAYTRTRTGCA